MLPKDVVSVVVIFAVHFLPTNSSNHSHSPRLLFVRHGLALALVEVMAEERVLEAVPVSGLAEVVECTVVLVHHDNNGYEVEFMTLDGETVAVVSLLSSQVRPISHREIAHARMVETG